MTPERERFLTLLSKSTGIQRNACRAFMQDMDDFIGALSRRFGQPYLVIAIKVLKASVKAAKHDKLLAMGLTQEDEAAIIACAEKPVQPIQSVSLPEAVSADELRAIFG